MKVESSPIPDIKIIQPQVFDDERGCFFEAYNRDKFSALVQDIRFCQDNESYSRAGVLRGLHYQLPPHAQAKLVRVVNGEIWDVAVDIRKNSATFKKWFGVRLSAENRLQTFIPTGFAHGFIVLSESATVQYKTDAFFSKSSERGIIFNDPEIGIIWPGSDSPILSSKDRALPALAAAEIFP